MSAQGLAGIGRLAVVNNCEYIIIHPFSTLLLTNSCAEVYRIADACDLGAGHVQTIKATLPNMSELQRWATHVVAGSAMTGQLGFPSSGA